MKLGIEKLGTDLLKGRRIGLLIHAASIDSNGQHTLDGLVKAGLNISVLFGPEHGIATRAQDMEPVPSRVDVESHIPVYSLYGDSFESLSPTAEMLEDIDVLLIDLQDIGSRYYTYIWTTALCMKACAELKKEVIVCDRPNPLGGIVVEGLPQKEGYESFVGLYPLPVRHGMTIGEIATYVNEEYKIGCELTVIQMEGWNRDHLWPKLKLPWTNPSPNMRSFNAELLYPGMCLIEGTNASEGRGTETPFDIIGAPFLDSDELTEVLDSLGLPGIHSAPTTFIPGNQKHAGRICHGIRWVVEDSKEFQPYLTGLALIWAMNKLYKNDGFAWRTEPYEFVTDIPAIDLLTGSDEFRLNIEKPFDKLKYLADVPDEFLNIRKKYLLY